MRRPGGQDDHLVRPGGAGRCGDRAARARVPPGHHRRPAASAADREPVRGGARGCRRPRGALPLHARRVHLQPDRHSPRRPALHAARFRRRLRRPHAPPAGARYASIEIKVSYLQPVRADQGAIEVLGRALRVGRRLAFAEAHARDANGALVGHTTTSIAVSRLSCCWAPQSAQRHPRHRLVHRHYPGRLPLRQEALQPRPRTLTRAHRPGRSAPSSRTPRRSTPSSLVPWRLACLRSAPSRLAPVRSAPLRSAWWRSASRRLASRRWASWRLARVSVAPRRSVSSKRARRRSALYREHGQGRLHIRRPQP